MDRDINPLAHYLTIGRAEGRGAASPAVLREEGGLDAEWYLRRYPDLAEASVDPYEHYWEHGWREGRDPGPHFSTKWYLKTNADVAGRGINPLEHYLNIGRDEGREPFRFATLRASAEREEISPWRAFFDEQLFFPRKYCSPPPRTGAFGDPDRQVIFFAGHSAGRSGAPLILLRLIESFAALPDVELFLFLESGGELVGDYRRVAHVFVNENQVLYSGGQQVMQWLVQNLAGRKPIPAVSNSAESWRIQREMRATGLTPVISLIHENLSRYASETRRLLCETADQIVFPSEATRLTAITADPTFQSSQVLPQGLLSASFGKGSRIVSRRIVRERLGISPRAKIVLACGTRDLRKGADLFIEVAARVAALSALDAHFVWLGSPTTEGQVHEKKGSRDDVAELRLKDRIHWIEAAPDPEEYFLAADVFVLTSRDDPFPCVVHEAMAAGLKIVVFEGNGGAPEAISGGCGIAVQYLNTSAMADAIAAMFREPDQYASLGVSAEAKVRTTYKFSDYADKIIKLATANIEPPIASKAINVAPKIFFSKRDWWISGPDMMSARIVRELVQRGMDARLLFVTLKQADQPFVPDVPLTILGIGDESWPEQWSLIEDFLRSNAPCILITGYDKKTSAVSPRLPNSVGVVGTLHADDLEHYDHAARLGHYWNRIIVVSEEIARKTRLYFGDAIAGKVRYIPNFVADSDFKIEGKREIRSAGEPICLIYVGRMVEKPKRVSDLARLSDRLDRSGVPFHLTMIGDGSERLILEAEMTPLVEKGRVTFLGRKSHEEVINYLRASDVLLLTSDTEGMSNSILEAMAQRCVPVVTWIPSGTPELVKNGETGFTFKVGDIEACCQCIAELQRHPKKVVEIGEAAFQHAYDWFRSSIVGGHYADELQAVWNEITSGSYKRPPSLIDGPFPGISVPQFLIKELHPF